MRRHRLLKIEWRLYIDRVIWKIACVIHNDIHLTHSQTFKGYRTPIIFLRHNKLKRACRGTNLIYGLVREGEVGCNYLCPSFCQRQCNRLTDTLGGAGYQRHSPFMLSAARLSAEAVCAGPPVFMLPAAAITTSTSNGFNS